MLLGAMVDAGLDVAALRDDLATLPLSGWTLTADRVVRSGLAGTQVRVVVDQPLGVERRLSDILAILAESQLSATVKSLAAAVFERLARVEAAVHGVSIDDVHFHEVGAVDSIVDVVGCMVALERLGIDRSYASSLPVGRGLVTTEHGTLPLPAPATLALLAEVHAPIRPADTDFELVTPTGAAILSSVAEFAQPPMQVGAIGTGFGSRDLPWPNVVRVWLGQAADAGLAEDEVTVLETNLDDCSPEQAGFAMERLFEAGALDVFFTAVQMKKNRPGVLLTVVAPVALARDLSLVVLRETTSLGVRFRIVQRLICHRRTETISTRLGDLQAKIKVIDNREVVCPEYEECARVARQLGLSIGAVYAEVIRAGASRES
jgi:uncharacterized protein (TIGR00299 family) protein